MPPPDESRHLLIAGAGGLGCPAALQACLRGQRVTLVDPDVVEASNLPRQVLFSPEHIGLPKSQVAAAVLRHLLPEAPRVQAVVARVDESTIDELLAGTDGHGPVDVLIDATDGAHAKDWLNETAVVRRVPLVHAAGLRSEGRLMAVPAGGRPCLACLFGRLTQETGSCADLGVWNGVVGEIGVRATELALAWPTGRTTYAVHDFADHRVLPLGAATDPACPTCAHPRDAVAPYTPFACEVVNSGTSDVAGSGAGLPVEDLREEHCPMNLLRARQIVEGLAPGGRVQILLGEEGAATVPDGLAEQGHSIVEQVAQGAGLALVVERGGSVRTQALTLADTRRFARQIVLPDVGVEGQQRLFDAQVTVSGPWDVARWAALYLLGAGVGHVTLESQPADEATGTQWFDFLHVRAHGSVLWHARSIDALSARVGDVSVTPHADAVNTAWSGIDLAHRVQRTIVLSGTT